MSDGLCKCFSFGRLKLKSCLQYTNTSNITLKKENARWRVILSMLIIFKRQVNI